jgi:hypothetical protein
MPAPTASLAHRGVGASRWALAVRASTPPSPSLSKRSTTHTYLRETITSTAQKKADRVASTLASLGSMPWAPAKASLKAYRGLVPMSP